MSTQQYLRSLNIIYLALFAGQIMFLLVAFYLTSTQVFGDAGDVLTEVYMIAVPLIIAGGLASSFFVTKMLLGSVKQLTTLKEKLERYRSAMIVKYALLEGPAFFAIVCYLITAHYLFAALAGLMMVVFLVNKPSAEKIAAELEFTREELKQFNDPKTLI